MYLIYETATGEPRMELSSSVLAEANLESGEAYIDLTNKAVDTSQILIIGGQVVPKERPQFDPVSYARHLRSGFLADSDWTQVTDTPLPEEVKQEWARYRQALRDFPAMIAAIAENEESARNVGSEHQVEDLLPNPPVD